MAEHDVRDFVRRTAAELQAEYERIQRTAKSDPGTAGDQGEENWAKLLREWLPPSFQVVTKGRILSENGQLSPQVDVLVLLPTYPAIMKSSKHFLAAGVAAAFECKLTLTAKDVKDSVATAAALRRILPRRHGTPFAELRSPIVFGLLAHSHSWKKPASTPVENVTQTLSDAEHELVEHPRECIDLVCVADLATWDCMKRFEAPLPEGREASPDLPPVGAVSTSMICRSFGDPNQSTEYSPVGRLLMSLYTMLAWTFPEMRPLESYFFGTLSPGVGLGRIRVWPSTVFSAEVRERIERGEAAYTRFDPWFVLVQ